MDEFVEKYVEMCQEAKKLQDAWKPKIGDRVANNGKFYGFEYLRKDDWVAPDWSNEPEYCEIWIDGDLWVPTQEDLQEIYMKENPCSHLSTVFTCFRYWYKEVYAEREGYGEQHHWNILWLEFVMWKCFEKQWDKKSGTWIKRLD